MEVFNGHFAKSRTWGFVGWLKGVKVAQNCDFRLGPLLCLCLQYTFDQALLRNMQK